MRQGLLLGFVSLVFFAASYEMTLISEGRLAVDQKSQTAASVVMFDENGNPEIFDETYPGSITNSPSDTFYTYGYEPVNDSYPDGSTGYYSSSYYYDPSYYYYDSYPTYSYATYVPSQPWYVQALPVTSIVTPIVQGVAPQTKPVFQPSCSISASPSSVQYGGSVVVRWQARNADWAVMNDLGIVDTSGSWSFDDLTKTHIYFLSVSGQGGTASCQTTVSVVPRR